MNELPKSRVELSMLPSGFENPVPNRLSHSITEKLLVFAGVMTEEEQTKLLTLSSDTKYRRAIRALFTYSRSFPLTTVSLPTPLTVWKPTDNPQIQDQLYGRLQYSVARDGQVLHYFGVTGSMSADDLQEFAKYSTGGDYETALNTLRSGSDRHFNAGGVFLSVFKWILILLAAEILKAIAQTVHSKFCDQKTFHYWLFRTPSREWIFGVVDKFFPPFSLWDTLMFYAVSLSIAVVTVLLLSRYFACIVDPLWRRVGIHRGELKADPFWAKRLASVGVYQLCVVGIIALVEFLLLFHAARAADEVVRWLAFLWWLVIADSLLFFGVPTILVVLRFVFILVAQLTLAVVCGPLIFFFWDVPRLALAVIRRAFGGAGADPELQCRVPYNHWARALDSVMADDRGRLRELANDYFFNFLDLVSIKVALWLLGDPFGWKTNPQTVAVFTLLAMTVLISWWNFSRNRELYRVHISVLRSAHG